jgi:hypothetical protein
VRPDRGIDGRWVASRLSAPEQPIASALRLLFFDEQTDSRTSSGAQRVRIAKLQAHRSMLCEQNLHFDEWPVSSGHYDIADEHAAKCQSD